jgi:hypothetical protein
VTVLTLEARDIEDEKGRAAASRYRIEEVDSPGELFERAFGVLDAEFGSKGELERRSVIEGWLRGRADAPGASRCEGYHLLVARDGAGALGAVRDCHVRVDPEAAACVAYLAHVVVMPEHRRSGLASLMRAAPLTLARRALAEADLSDGDVLLAAEMEPVVMEDPASIARLVAYGRAGFSVVDPTRLPYCQPDFRDLAALGSEARPLPLLAVVRWVGHERAERVPRRLAAAYLENLYAVFATHCRAEDLAAPREHALRVLLASEDPVPLLRLPTGPDDHDALRPLLRREVLSHYGGFS